MNMCNTDIQCEQVRGQEGGSKKKRLGGSKVWTKHTKHAVQPSRPIKHKFSFARIALYKHD